MLRCTLSHVLMKDVAIVIERELRLRKDRRPLLCELVELLDLIVLEVFHEQRRVGHMIDWDLCRCSIL